MAWIPYKESPEKGFFRWLNKRYKKHKKGHEDTVIVVCGGEQLGKSRWTIRTIYGLDRNIFIDKDGKIDLSHVTISGKDFRYIATHIKKSVMQDDEAVTHFYSRRAMSEENVACNQVVATCGSRHNMIFLLIPSFFVLDSYIKEHRVKAIVKIYPRNRFKTWVFVKNNGDTKDFKLKKILNDKTFSVRHSSKGWWSEKNNTEELNQILKDYFKKSEREKQKIGETLRPKKEAKFRKEKDVIKDHICRLYKTKKYTQKQLAEMFSLSRQTVVKYLNEKVNLVKE